MRPGVEYSCAEGLLKKRGGNRRDCNDSSVFLGLRVHCVRVVVVLFSVVAITMGCAVALERLLDLADSCQESSGVPSKIRDRIYRGRYLFRIHEANSDHAFTGSPVKTKKPLVCSMYSSPKAYRFEYIDPPNQCLSIKCA